jgi:FtsP/CotA-like multicopper oxidase with cupredoxin domain
LGNLKEFEPLASLSLIGRPWKFQRTFGDEKIPFCGYCRDDCHIHIHNGGKFLFYGDLRAAKPLYPPRRATREIELRLTGNMERYIWSINGTQYRDADPIRLQYGERVRFKFVNETIMTHPMHLHGMWTILDAGAGEWNPVKHLVSVAPGTTVYTETEVDAPGHWAFHCHLAYHAASGMFRCIIVEGGPKPDQG